MITRNEELARFATAFAGDNISRELILFLGKHPCARFSQLVLRSALGGTTEIASSLHRLAGQGIIKTGDGNGVALYWLTDEEPIRSLVMGIAGMDFIEKKRLLFGNPELMAARPLTCGAA